MVKTIKIVLVDQHAMFRDAIAAYLERVDDFVVCIPSPDSAGALDYVREENPHVLLLNASSTNGGGLHLISRVRDLLPSVRVAVYSQDQHEFAYSERAAVLGARAFFCKTDDGTALVSGIRKIMRGGRYCCTGVAAFGRRSGRFKELAESMSDPIKELSSREYEVFQMIGWGYSITEIAERLTVNSKTIETYLMRTRKKLDIRESSRLLQSAIAYTHCGLAKFPGELGDNAGPCARGAGGMQPPCGKSECCCVIGEKQIDRGPCDRVAVPLHSSLHTDNPTVMAKS